MSKKQQWRPLSPSANDLNETPERPSDKPAPEKQAYLSKRRQAATAAGLELCSCGGVIWQLSTGLRKCGDCGSVVM